MTGSAIEAGPEIRTLGAIFAALLGLAFGSFLNVCLSRLPEGESIVQPRSHCRNCTHTLAWWENLPLLSWLILRGRCRQCRTWIAIRYPLVELAVGLLWAGCWIYCEQNAFMEYHLPVSLKLSVTLFAGLALLSWLLVALAALDAEYLWLPDWLTLPGIALGFAFAMGLNWVAAQRCCVHYDVIGIQPTDMRGQALYRLVEILAAAGIILVIRLAYWLVRRKEGMGLGDAKLMAMLAAWLGLPAALESFALAILAATVAALVWMAVSAARRQLKDWAKNAPAAGHVSMPGSDLRHLFS